MRNVLEYLEKTACLKSGENTILDAVEEISYKDFVQTSQGVGASLLSHYAKLCFSSSCYPLRKPVLVLMDKGINAGDGNI